MISAQIILDTRRKSKKGYSIKIRVYDGKLHKYISLKQYQEAKKLKLTPWLRKRDAQLIDEVEFCNANNLDIIAAIEVIKQGLPDSVDNKILALEQQISQLRKSVGIGLIEFFDIIILEKERSGASTLAFERTRNQLNNYLLGEDININLLDYEWVQKFIIYKRSQGCGDGGLSYYIRTAGTVFREAKKRKSLNIIIDNPFAGHNISRKRKKDIDGHTFEDLKKLLSYEPNRNTSNINKEKLIRCVDLFLFQFSIGGQDYADIAALRWSSIQKGRIRFKRFKNRSKSGGGPLIDIKLSDFAKSVIDKYGDKETDRIFSFIPDPSRDSYIDSRRQFWKSLQSISKSLDISPSLRTKTPRYVFRTTGGELLIDSYIISKLQGHTLEGVSFGYQGTIPYNVLDKEHEKILAKVFN